jgi:Fe-S cluster biosynthesis and repair protein YggX
MLVNENKENLMKGNQFIRQTLEKEYTIWFVKTHMMVEPMTYDRL